MEKYLPQRKSIRLNDYDYSKAGYYFITICTENKKMMLWSTVGATTGRPPLNESCEIIETALKNIETKYPNVCLDEYVIMPNHIHFILVLENLTGRPMVAPTVSRIVQQFKGYVSKNIRKSDFSWQKSYHEHIIRNEQELRETREYIFNNPFKWKEDEYYIIKNQT